MKANFKVDISSSELKKGVEIKFSLPKDIESEDKKLIEQKILNKLNESLSPLKVILDDNTQFTNTVSFLILVSDIKLILKDILKTNK